MIKFFLVFRSSGLCIFSYSYNETKNNPTDDSDGDLLTNLLRALSIMAQEIVGDEISKVELRGHSILIQKVHGIDLGDGGSPENLKCLIDGVNLHQINLRVLDLNM